MITAPHSVSLDGFIADADRRSDRLHAWLRSGDTPSRLNPSFTMPSVSARFFDQGVTVRRSDRRTAAFASPGRQRAAARPPASGRTGLSAPLAALPRAG